MASSIIDPSILLSGDLIGIQIDNLGLLCIPSSDEPIPEKEEKISHLRLSQNKKLASADYRRCMFKIENDSGPKTKIKFGSAVRLSHHPTNMVVVASSTIDSGYRDGELNCVFLQSSIAMTTESIAHKWIVVPRFKLREEGDPVRSGDFIMLRNAQHKHLFLTSFPVSNEGDHLVGLAPSTLVMDKPGINVVLLRNAPGEADDLSGSQPGGKKGNTKQSKEGEEEAMERGVVYSTDFLRVLHREYGGHLICRTDDNNELESSVAPLGATNRKRGDQRLEHNVGVFLRSLAEQQPREQVDFPPPFTAQGIWQILTAEPHGDKVAMHGLIKFGSSVRFRHVITGQFLCIRPIHEADSVSLKTFSSDCLKRTNIRKQKKKLAQAAAAAAAAASADNTGGASAALATSSGEAKLIVTEIKCDNLNSSGWYGSHKNSIELEYGGGGGEMAWKHVSEKSAFAGDSCSWKYDRMNSEMHFSADEEDLQEELLRVTVFREHVISDHEPIGVGAVLLSSFILPGMPANSTAGVLIDLKDPATGQAAGSAVVKLVVNPEYSAQELRILEEQEAERQKIEEANAAKLKAIQDAAAAAEDEDEDAASDSGRGRTGAQTAGGRRAAGAGGGGGGGGDDEAAAAGDGGADEEGAVLSPAVVSGTTWVIGTTSHPSKYTKFTIQEVDHKIEDEAAPLTYHDRFVLEHFVTRQHLQLSSLHGFDRSETWWEYHGDSALVPAPHLEGSTIDLEVCQFDRVDRVEIQDTLYGMRFRRLVDAATISLQLTPRAGDLYSPLYRHFQTSLMTLTLWALGKEAPGATLVPITRTGAAAGGVDAKKEREQKIQELARDIEMQSSKGDGGAGGGTGVVEEDGTGGGGGEGRETDHEDDDDDEEEEDDDDDSDDESYFNGEVDENYIQRGSSKGVGGAKLNLKQQVNIVRWVQRGRKKRNNNNLSSSTTSGGGGGKNSGTGSEYQALSLTDPSDAGAASSPSRPSSSSATVQQRAISRQMSTASAVGRAVAARVGADNVFEMRKQELRREVHSSLAPWVGRKVDPAALTILNEFNWAGEGLRDYTNHTLKEFIRRDLPQSETVYRRQMILCDCHIIDALAHFLNVLYLLQRALSLTDDPNISQQYPFMPYPLVLCTMETNHLMRAAVYKNEKVALKLVSTKGAFISLINQKMQGWNPPLESIFLQTCTDAKTGSTSNFESLNSQNESLILSAINKSGGAGGESSKGDSEGGSSDNARGMSPEEGGAADSSESAPAEKKKQHATFRIENILVSAVSAGDVREVVQQMHYLHLKGDPTALKIMQLLTLLCSSGQAKKYFQNIIINAISNLTEEDEAKLTAALNGADDVEEQDFTSLRQRPTSLQSNSMLFFTKYDPHEKWQVKFGNDFSFVTISTKNQERMRSALVSEGSSLLSLFSKYDADGSDVLDLDEGFDLLRDLAVAGPFLLNEVRYLEGTGRWGFAKWWCHRCCFYYHSAAIDRYQMNPLQAMKMMGIAVQDSHRKREMGRTLRSEQEICEQISTQELLNDAIDGFSLTYFSSEEEGDSIGGVVGDDDVARSTPKYDNYDTAALLRAGLSRTVSSSTSAPALLRPGVGTFQASKSGRPPSSSGASAGAGFAFSTSGAMMGWVPIAAILNVGQPQQQQQQQHQNESANAAQEAYESHWFRSSLALLSAVCSGANSNAQRIVSTLLPAECLMSALRDDSIALKDRSVICTLLTNAYVNHRLVFSSRFTPTHSTTQYMGFNEEVFNPEDDDTGKVFNPKARTSFKGAGSLNGTDLREDLFSFLCSHMISVQLFSLDPDSILYAKSLLGLFNELLRRGFFQEKEFAFFPPNTSSTTSTSMGATLSSSFPGSPSSSLPGPAATAMGAAMDGALGGFTGVVDSLAQIPNLHGNAARLTADSMLKLMVQKLNFVLQMQKATKDFTGRVNPQANAETSQQSAEEDGGAPTAGQTLSLSEIFNLTALSELAAGNNKSLKQMLKQRSTFDNLREHLTYFDVIFMDDTMVEMIRSAVSILTLLHDMQQMIRLSTCWNFVGGSCSQLKSRAIASTEVDPEELLGNVNFSGLLQSTFYAFKPVEEVPGITEALFSATLYDDHTLRHQSFELLDRKSSLVRDAQSMYSQLILVNDAAEAHILRLTEEYRGQLEVCAREILDGPYPTPTHLLVTLEHTLETLRDLYFVAPERAALAAAKAKEEASTTAMAQLQKAGSIMNIFSFMDSGSHLLKDLEYFRQSFPLTDDDEEDVLDALSVTADPVLTEKLRDHFDTYHQVNDLQQSTSTLVDQTQMHKSKKLLQLLLEATRAPHFLPWHALYDAEKFLVDQLLGFLSELGRSMPEAVCMWYPYLNELLIAYFPDSLGCSAMIATMLEFCLDALAGMNSFAKHIMRQIDISGLFSTKLCSAVLSALLRSKDETMIDYASGLLLNRIPQFCAAYDFKAPPTPLQDDLSLCGRLYSVIYPISLLLERNVAISTDVLLSLRKQFSTRMCKKYLGSAEVPLYIKSCLSVIAEALHPYVAVPVESLLLSELREIQKVYSAEVPQVNYHETTKFCREFLFRGVITTVRNRLMNSRVVKAEVILDVIEMEMELSVNSSAITNKQVANGVREQLQEHFDLLREQIHETVENHEARAESAAESHSHSQSRSNNNNNNNNNSRGGPRIDLAVVQSVLMALKSFGLRGCALAKKLTTQQRCDLIWVCAACRALVASSRDCIRIANSRPNATTASTSTSTSSRNFTSGKATTAAGAAAAGGGDIEEEGAAAGTQRVLPSDAEYSAIVSCLTLVLHGLTIDLLTSTIDSSLTLFFERELRSLAQRQFLVTARTAAKQGVPEQKHHVFGTASQRERTEKLRFENSMEMAVIFPKDYLMATPMFQFLRKALENAARFIDLNGDLLFGDWHSPLVKSRAYAARFRKYSDFDLWMRGGGVYLQSMFAYLARVEAPRDSEYNMIHMTVALLSHKIDDIQQNATLSLNRRQQLVKLETKRLRRLQTTVNSLGAQNFVGSVLGGAYNNPSEHHVWLYTPLAISLYNEIISWGNRSSQESMMDLIEFNIARTKPPEMNGLLGLRYLIRKCNLEIAYCAAPTTKIEQTRSAAGGGAKRGGRRGEAGDGEGDGDDDEEEEEANAMEEDQVEEFEPGADGDGLELTGDMISSSLDEIEEGKDGGSSSSRRLMSAAEANGLLESNNSGKNAGKSGKYASADKFWTSYSSTSGKNNSDPLVFVDKNQIPDSEHAKILRTVKQLFTFMGLFCKGDNARAQRFFSAYQTTDKHFVDLVLELCLLLNAVLTKFSSMVVYIRNSSFIENFAPLVWEDKDAAKRRYLAWHHPSNNIMLFCQYLHTMTAMFDSMLSLCCDETIVSVHQALVKCPLVLEFTGLMQLEAVFHKGSSLFGNHFTWSGGNPFAFYATYATVMNEWMKSDHASAASLNDELEQEMIVDKITSWSKIIRERRKHRKGFRSVFGISRSLFHSLVHRAETKCLAAVLDYLDSAASTASYEMASRFNDGILLQNMDVTFEKIYKGGFQAHDVYADKAVAYISLIESIGIHFPASDALLEQWDDESKERGKFPKSIYGVVEIIGKGDKTQRVYFPVPTFVTRFWSYPEVQKVKDAIVLDVNRSSPEEKIADFWGQMDRIITVMKRQELLKTTLTWPIHAFFGGKSFSAAERFFPKQRMLLLLLTLVMNFYVAYMTSLGNRFEVNEDSLISSFTNWEYHNRFIYTVQLVHVLLNCSLAFSRILNTHILDEMRRTELFRDNLPLLILVAPFAVVYDAIWPCFMFGLSMAAYTWTKFWLYVPGLFDLIFQLHFMSFLYMAVAKNAIKIFYTLLLAFLFLYFYAVLATLYFAGQYEFNEHGGCSNLIACFKLHLDYGLYEVPDWQTSEGYISPHLPLPFVYGQLLSNAIGTMYNVSYVILINLVLQSIISGLIIDTFSQLRQANEEIVQDINDKCFICSIMRDDFEQSGVPFVDHIKEEHNMWHYVWFKIYLEAKDPLAYSGTEIFVADKIDDKQDFLNLMPIKRSLSLELKGELHESDDLGRRIDELMLSLARIQQTNKSVSASVTTLQRVSRRIEGKVVETASIQKELYETTALAAEVATHTSALTAAQPVLDNTTTTANTATNASMTAGSGGGRSMSADSSSGSGSSAMPPRSPRGGRQHSTASNSSSGGGIARLGGASMDA